MQNDKLRAIRDFIVKRGKFLFPVVIVAAAAVTVTVALNVGRGTPAEIVQTEQETASVFETAAQETQEQTAKATGMTLRHYQRFEAGDSLPGFDNLCALADHFEVSLDYLAGRTDER